MTLARRFPCSLTISLVLFLVSFASLGCAAFAATPPQLGTWEDDMRRFGKIHCDTLREHAATGSFDQKLGDTYYDAERVYYQIADYTGDASWLQCANLAEQFYRDLYVFPNKGGVPGYWNFTRGLRIDYERTQDEQSKQAVIMLSKNAAYSADASPVNLTVNCAFSREVAYAIMGFLNAEALGESPRARKAEFITQALGHIDQWFIGKTCPYVRPFMVGLTLQALMQAYDSEPDERIPPAIDKALDGIWACCWVPFQQAFMYTNIVAPDGSGGKETAPDLNLLIAPAFGWRYLKTGNPIFRDRGDEVFSGGVQDAYLHGIKQFNQNYMASFDYVTWRKAADLKYSSGPGGPSPSPTTPAPGGKGKSPGQLKVR
jgi:hypothetical protein